MDQLKHDPESGFLRGESIADEIEQLAQELKLLRSIDANTSDIAKRLGQLGTANAPILPEPAGASRAPTIVNNTVNSPEVPRATSAARVRVPAPTSPTAREQSPANPAGDWRKNVIVVNGRDAVSPRPPGTRDESGRFTTRGQNKDEDKSVERPTSESSAKSIGGAISSAVRDASQRMTSDVDNVDPTIQAAKEVSGILSPVSALVKPFGALFGRGDDAKQTKEHRESIGWLRRIWRTQADGNKIKGRGLGGMLGMLIAPLMALLSALMLPLKALGRLLGMGGLLRAAGSLLGGRRGGRARGRVDASGRRTRRSGADARDTRRRWQERAAARNGNGGPSRSGGPAANAGTPGQPGTVAAGARARTPVPGGAPPAAGGPRPAGRLGGVGTLTRGAGAGLLGMGKGLLSKLPVLGALFGVGMVASSAMANDDPELSTDENKKNKWGNVGGGVGGLIGGVAGLVGGPAGAIAGGMLGDAIGSAVGEWLSTVDFSKAVESISTAAAGFADVAIKTASAAFDYVKEGWLTLVTLGSNTFSSMADWARDTWKGITDKVADWKDTVVDKVKSASDYVENKVDRAKDVGSNVLYKASGGRVGTGGSAAAKDEMIKAMDAGGITDPKSKAMLMANVDHESGGFTRKEENLNYSAKRLQEVFPKYYKNAEDARTDAGNPEAIANKVYGGRMGNTEQGDGFKYRGRGSIQLTGKAQYEAMGKKLGIDLVNNPDLAIDPKYSAQIAVEHWKSSGADRLAQAGDVVGSRRRTNGGLNGLADVEGKYEAYLAQAQAGDLTPTRRADELRVAAPAAVGTAVASTMATVSRRDKGAAPVGATPANTANPIGVLPMAQPRGANITTLAGAQSVAPVAPAAVPVQNAQVARNAQAVTPIGILAASQARATAAVNTSAPATVVTPRISSYAPAAADSSQMRIPATPEVKTPTGSGRSKEGAQSITLEMPLSQDVNDRGIAHASSGGIGMRPL